MSEVLRHPIGEAARLVGVSPATLRLWEQEGLIQPPRTRAGHRLYDENDLNCLHRIQYLRKEHGLNIAAIRLELGQSRNPDDDRTPTNLENESLEIGKKLRQYRQRQKLTLKQVSKRTVLSVSFISAVERGATGISLASLLKLALAYNIHLEDLYDAVPGTNRNLVRVAERKVFEQNLKGVRIEQLTHGPGLMEAQRFVLDPGASSEGSYSHEGEELIYVLDGSVEFYLGGSEHHHLEAGDCLYFPSSMYHRWVNEGTSKTNLLWVDAQVPFTGEKIAQISTLNKGIRHAGGRRTMGRQSSN